MKLEIKDLHAVVIDNETGQEYEISLKKQITNIVFLDFSIEIKGDSDRKKIVLLMDKLAQDIMTGKLLPKEDGKIKSKRIR